MNIHFKIVHVLICTLFAGAVLLGMTGLSPAMAYTGEVVVICNDSVSADTMKRRDIKDIFLGKNTRWEDGQKITFVMLSGGDAHESFLREYVGKTPSQFRTYWKKKAFTGKGRIPETFATPEEVIDFVVKTPGAIGYIPSDAYQNQIKSMMID